MPRTFALCAVLTPLLLMPLLAAADEPDTDRGRFSLSPVDGGVLRLDRQTGAVALCAKKGEAWRCDEVEDKAKLVEDRLKQLEQENKDLKGHIANLERMLEGQPKPGGNGNGADTDKAPPAGTMPIPSEEDVDKAFDYIERMVKKLRERIERLDKPAPDATPSPPPAPEHDGGGRL